MNARNVFGEPIGFTESLVGTHYSIGMSGTLPTPIAFRSVSRDYISIEADGPILVNGKPAENDAEIVAALRAFAREYTKS